MFKVNNNYSTLTPEGILPILENDEWFQNQTPKITENALIFCTILFLHQYYYKEKNGDNKKDQKNPYQNIGTDLIIKILARDKYVEILKRLLELKIIETNDSYKTGVYTKSYRLAENFLNQKPIAKKIRFNSKKMENLNDYFAEKKLVGFDYLFPQYKFLQLIHIDYDNALEFIENNIDVIKNVDHYLKQVYKINSGFTRKISVSDVNRRVHSSLTSFPKKLRRFLCLVDTETGEQNFANCIIDGKNTQPLLISVLMEKEGVVPDIDFKNFCLNGTLYDEMAKELSESRNWVKKYMMKAILFTPNNSKYTHKKKMRTIENNAKKKISLYFKNRFPIVFDWLIDKKKSYKNSNLKSKNYFNKGGSLLAYEIQKMEAELWIHQLLKEMTDDIIYITIHDSIMIFNPRNEQIDFVENKVKEIGTRLYNIEIPLSIDSSMIIF